MNIISIGDFIMITGRYRTSNACIPENHMIANEVRFVRATKGVSFKDERLAFATVQGVPCAVFSTIPFYKTARNVR